MEVSEFELLADFTDEVEEVGNAAKANLVYFRNSREMMPALIAVLY